jgi:NTP pyrophosphatase (non-canonical NTP hydrolase)
MSGYSSTLWVELTMDLGALQEKTKHDIKRFEARLEGKNYDEILFLYMSKITEEIGNMAAAVLGREGIQAEQPVSNDELVEVFADTLYSILVLAQKMNINIDRVVQEKISRIDDHGPQEEGF